MEGYVKNISPLWRHAMKRAVAPGEKIELDDLYEQYGVKHGFDKGKTFVDWIRQVKLKDQFVWEIRYREESSVAIDKVVLKEDKPSIKEDSTDGIPEKTESKQTPFVKKNTQVSDIVNMSVRQAREFLPKFTDQKLLKYALNEASQLAGKDSLCQMLRKRITLLELSRR